MIHFILILILIFKHYKWLTSNFKKLFHFDVWSYAILSYFKSINLKLHHGDGKKEIRINRAIIYQNLNHIKESSESAFKYFNCLESTPFHFALLFFYTIQNDCNQIVASIINLERRKFDHLRGRIRRGSSMSWIFEVS